MLHEVLLALLGHSGGIVKDKGDGLKVQSDLPFLHSAEVEQLNYLCRLGTHYNELSRFIKQYGHGLVTTAQGKAVDGIHGLYLNSFCTGLEGVLDAYRGKVLELETHLLRDPHLSIAHLVCQLQQYQLVFPALSSILEQIESHKAHGCYILDIVHKHSETGHPIAKEVLTRILHVCHGVLYKHLCSWLLYGYVYDPYHEFFIQPSAGESHDPASQSEEEEEDDLGIMGVTGRQLQKMLKLNITESVSSSTHLFSVHADLLPSYIPVRVANNILFVGESINLFQDKGKTSPTHTTGSILKGKEDHFAKELHQLAKEPVFNSMNFESLINDIRTHAAEHLWTMLVRDANLLEHLRIIKDFYLLGRGELYLAFIDQAQHLLRVPATATTEHDVNAAYMQAARNVLFHDDALLQRFRLSVKVPDKKILKRDSTSSSGSSQSSVIEPGWTSLSLDYTVQWPLHIFFTPNALDKYKRVFRFLLAVRRTQLGLHHCWSVQMRSKHRPSNRSEAAKWQLRTHMSFLVDNLQYYLQVDVIESQYGILVDRINKTRDYEAVKLAHDQFLSALLAQSFVHMRSVAYCLYEIIDQCSAFTLLVDRCEYPMSSRDTAQLELVSKNLQRQSSLLFKMLSSVRSNSSSPHLAQLLLRLDFNKYFSISGGCLGRRCSDLQALRLGEGSIAVQRKGITFICHGLAKQDRQSHYGAKIFVPAFDENKSLDPKRALFHYLKKTDTLRTDENGNDEVKLFLSVNFPHKPVSAQTISNWIVNTVRMAYNDNSLKVKGHSTRAVAPSWALLKGSSMKAIMEAADWSRQSTFAKFYLRNVKVNVLT